MTANDMAEFVARMLGRWQNAEVAEESLRQLGQDLQDLDGQEALAALDAYAVEGHAWPPTSGQIRARVAAAQVDAPSFAGLLANVAAWRAARAAQLAWVCPDGLCDGDGFVEDGKGVAYCACRPQMLARRWEGLHPLVQAAIEKGVLTTQLLDRVQEDRTVEAQVRDRWAGYTADAQKRAALSALPTPPGVSAQVDRARVEQSQLRKLGARALLEKGDRIDP